ncbi:KilA-N domain-containing protein [Xanthobacter flavus]|uniref:KilA-N domain-containing protein n=1 Tax=Xanthobacter flavus TaxID=281 RepID=UPI00372678E9
MQYHLDLIPHETGGFIIHQRPKDGYINATAMCQAADKEWKHYNENKTHKAFFSVLATEVGIPTSELIQTLRGGHPHLQGTWVHPRVAIHLAQWLSPEFAVQVSGWVFDWMSGKTPARSRPELPYHLRRYIANQNAVPVGHFSILVEMIQLLIGPMESMGYTLPEDLLPDISMGLMFCKWLRDEHSVDTDALPVYIHLYEDGRRVKAKAYPEALLPHFRRHFREEWFPKKAEEYFRKRDAEALAYLPRLLRGPRAA